MYRLSERERNSLAQADRLNAILSQSSIPEAAASAQLRAKEQALARRDQRSQLGDETLLQARLGVSQQEGELDRAAAQQRAQTMATNLTAGQRGNIDSLTQGINMIDALTNQIDRFESGGGATGGTGGAVEWIAEQVGFDPATEYVRRERDAGNPGLEQLRAASSAVSTMAAQAYMKGVMSDQDFQRIKTLDLSNPNLSLGQLRDRIAAARGIMESSLSVYAGSGQMRPPQYLDPAAGNASPTGNLSPNAQKYLSE